MPNHPPIPPNCDFFRDDEFHFPYSYHWPLTTKSVEGRLVISAIARCAWLDEAERIQSQHIYEMKDVKISRANAEAWRKWGRGEKWE